MDGMKKKSNSLMHRTMSQFFLCTVAFFLLMAPVFYLVTKHFYAEDLIDVIEAIESGRGVPPLDLERDIMAGVMLQFVLTFGIISAAMFVTVRYITRKIWMPFDDTLRKAEKFNLAQSDVPEFADTEIAEFRRLNDSLSRLMRKSRETYRIQKEFTENASHELQTPLAVTRTKLDLLMQENLEAGPLELVAELYSLNTRMGHLNRNLLLLAKIENSQYDELEEIAPAEFIAALLPSYNMLKCGCRVEVNSDEASRWTLKANPILLESMLNNLVVNAIRHTPRGEIIVDVSQPGIIAVINPAENGALDSESLFKRFSSGNAGSGGNGLGLAIVKAICDFHGWQVEYSYLNSTHMFTVSAAEKS